MTQPWRNHPKLQGRFHHSAPDDVQVVVHDGGPRLSDRAPEVVWVTVTDLDANDVFTARVLNQPHHLKSVAQGTEIKFVAPSGDHLLMVTDKYLLERPNWNIHPCHRCGLDELLDAPSDLLPVIVPALPANAMTDKFTSFCGLCGGVQVVETTDTYLREHTPVQQEKKKWWQVWK